MDLTHFLDAQERDHAKAMAELRAGRKRTHWIWYVFPILVGLRESSTALRFALPDDEAAREYLRHPVLGARLREAIAIVHEQVCAQEVPIAVLMGSDVDAHKLVSSLTLFSHVAADVADETLAQHAEAVLDAAQAQGIPRCALTEAALT